MLTRPKLRRAPDDVAIVKILTDGIRGTEMPSAGDTMSEQEIRQTAAYVRSLGKIEVKPVPGNPALGAALYRSKGNCAACHWLNGEGGVAGPDLTDIGERRSAAYLSESLVNPETDLPENYLLVAVATKDGRKVTGVRVNEDSFSLQIRDAEGRSHSFWKTDLASIEKQRGKSGMPSFKSRLTNSELVDLVAYLASLKPTAAGDAK
jgi:cytochrome c oxidase cbb3-type subunit III